MLRWLLVLGFLNSVLGTSLHAQAPPVRASPQARFTEATLLPATAVTIGAWSPRLSRADTTVYENTNTIQAWYSGGSSFEYADDIHMTMGGRLKDLIFAYFNNTAAQVSAVIQIYGNTADNDALLERVAGPYVAQNLPGPGPVFVSVVPPDNPTLPEHVWVSFAFSSAEAGLIFADPPMVGTSENVWLDVAAQNVEVGIPGFAIRANWWLRVRVEMPVAVEEQTWTQVKKLYASR